MLPFDVNDVHTSYYRCPDGEEYFVYVWVKGGEASDSYILNGPACKKNHHNCLTVDAVQKVAKERFIAQFLLENSESDR